MLRALLALMVGASLIGCADVDTLGDEEPTEVKISGTPTWENGIGQLMVLKCANCHIPGSSYAPANTPQYTNFSNSEDAKMAAPWIVGGILDHDVANVRQMPLDYSTPLTQNEKDALLEWAQNVMWRGGN